MNFRHLLEKHQLAPAILAVIKGHLLEKDLSLRRGTMVDATLIHAPVRLKTKRESAISKCIRQKGNQYYSGIKAHMSANVDSGSVHHVQVEWHVGGTRTLPPLKVSTSSKT
jgi:IS5 family transposase